MKKSCQVHGIEAKVNEPAQPAAGWLWISGPAPFIGGVPTHPSIRHCALLFFLDFFMQLDWEAVFKFEVCTCFSM